MSEPTPLRVFTDDYDTYAAVDEADLRLAWMEHAGGGEDDGFEPESYGEVPGDKSINIWCDSDGLPTSPDEDGPQLVTRTAAEWAARLGRGLICTTEY